MISLARVIQSFRDAWRGIARVFKTEQNFRIQLGVGAVVIAGMFIFRLKSWEIIVLILLVLLVLIVEMLNTAIEYFSDLMKPRMHHYVEVIKDIMAGVVLLTSIVALIIGVIIFLPHFKQVLQ